DLLLLALDQLVLRGEAGFDVDSDLRLRQVAAVPHRCEDDVLGPEEWGEGPRLARRLDDDQTLHSLDFLWGSGAGYTVRATRPPGRDITAPATSSAPNRLATSDGGSPRSNPTRS